MRVSKIDPRRRLAWTCAGLLCLLFCVARPARADDAIANPSPLRAIAAIDLPRYMGSWYEIARYPNRFQKKCVGFTRADYSILADGSVQVANQCRLADGSTDRAVGQARQLGSADSPRLKVRFAPAWLSFLPAVWGDYWVIDLDRGYQLVAVSEPKREYLWVLARTPVVDAAPLEALFSRLHEQGFDLHKLLRTPQQ
ncbi:MAG: lipocalin family protein [Herminiimonas sp.]|nr:lipocalin family protein [Herminiimonas sp.]